MSNFGETCENIFFPHYIKVISGNSQAHQLTVCNKHDEHGNKIRLTQVRSTWISAFVHSCEVKGKEPTIKAKEIRRFPLNFSMQANLFTATVTKTIIETS